MCTWQPLQVGIDKFSWCLKSLNGFVLEYVFNMSSKCISLEIWLKGWLICMEKILFNQIKLIIHLIDLLWNQRFILLAITHQVLGTVLLSQNFSDTLCFCSVCSCSWWLCCVVMRVCFAFLSTCASFNSKARFSCKARDICCSSSLWTLDSSPVQRKQQVYTQRRNMLGTENTHWRYTEL